MVKLWKLSKLLHACVAIEHLPIFCFFLLWEWNRIICQFFAMANSRLSMIASIVKHRIILLIISNSKQSNLHRFFFAYITMQSWCTTSDLIMQSLIFLTFCDPPVFFFNSESLFSKECKNIYILYVCLYLHLKYVLIEIWLFLIFLWDSLNFHW